MPQKPLELVPVTPPPPAMRARRNAAFAAPGEKRTRYSLPTSLDSASPIGYRTRVAITAAEARDLMPLFSLERPTAFAAATTPVVEQALFEETTLGILTARQSTNYQGHRQVTFGPADSAKVAGIVRRLNGLEAPVLEGATHTHLVLSRPYRTPFTMLLTLVGHSQVASPFTVAKRLYDKKRHHKDDIPTIGYLQFLHLGILADAMERAAVIASDGRRRANVLMNPFCGARRAENRAVARELEDLCGLSTRDRISGWRVALVAQVGEAIPEERITAPRATLRKLAANLVAFRSERIQPGVNTEPVAPPPYQHRQDMDVSDTLTEMAGRAAANAFSHWTGCDRDRAKELLMLERVDVLTPNGKERLREIRQHLNDVTDKVVKQLPVWADLPTGKAFSKNAARGKKAFALTGQRVYITGVSRPEIEREEIDFELAVRGVGAAASRAATYAEVCGVVDLPPDCDLLAGTCLMAGPVNQNDIGKAFYGASDLLDSMYPGRQPTSLLVWTLKAKTVADPIGNEEQLMNAARKGALVDLRPGPHEVISIRVGDALVPMRRRAGRVNTERAFSEAGNFVTDAAGRGIPGNAGSEWPEAWRAEPVWPGAEVPRV